MTDRQTENVDALADIPRLSPADRRIQAADEDDEPMGGDPPCWAHLFEDDDAPERQ